MWACFFFASVALMLLAGRMAQGRRRSQKAWVWATFLVGPLGPVALYMLGDRRDAISLT